MAVDRDVFSREVQTALEAHPNVEVVREKIDTLPADAAAIAFLLLTWAIQSYLLLRFVLDIDDREALEISIMENLQREDLNAVEETEAVLHLLQLSLDLDRPGQTRPAPGLQGGQQLGVGRAADVPVLDATAPTLKVMNTTLAQLRTAGCISTVPNLGSPTPFGACIGLDPVHPSATGQRHIANALISVINAKYGTDLEPIA